MWLEQESELFNGGSSYTQPTQTGSALILKGSTFTTKRISVSGCERTELTARQGCLIQQMMMDDRKD